MEFSKKTTLFRIGMTWSYEISYNVALSVDCCNTVEFMPFDYTEVLLLLPNRLLHSSL